MLELILIIGVPILLIILFNRFFKVLKVGSMCLTSGGVKCGKSTFSVYMAIKYYKRIRRRVKIRNFFARIFGKCQEDLPLLYSNIPLTVPHVPLTENLLLRKERFVYRSVILCDEASLIADSQLIKDMDINQQLLLFNKLIGHETKGGILFYTTQSVADVHYSIKRCLSEYFYIHHLTKWIPFFLVAYVKECRYSEDLSTIDINTEDVESKLKRVVIPKSTFKKFDSYCYSILTDHLPVNDNVVSNLTSLKAQKIISFRSYQNEEKNDINFG